MALKWWIVIGILAVIFVPIKLKFIKRWLEKRESKISK